MIVETCYTQASDPDRYIEHETCQECKISEGLFSPPLSFSRQSPATFTMYG